MYIINSFLFTSLEDDCNRIQLLLGAKRDSEMESVVVCLTFVIIVGSSTSVFLSHVLEKTM